MKKFTILVSIIALSAAVFAQAAKPAPAATAAPEVQADVSYSLGMLFGANIKSSGLKISPDGFLAGMKDALDGKPLKYTDAQAQSAVQAAVQAVQAKKNADNLAAGNAFLDGNKKKAGVTVTPSGLQYEVITLGKGAKPVATDTVTVNYEGKLLNGTVFDSSIERGEPASFPLNGVIAGWTEGVQLMPVGSKYRFYVPAALAYGEQGAGNAIEPNSVLIFEVELVSIDTGKADPEKK
jgi:FKBP-type peptidyl-prolyl cis-trans isomerase